MPSDPVAKRETPSRYFSSYSYDCRHYALGSLASQTPFLKGILARLRPWLIRHNKSTSDTGGANRLAEDCRLASPLSFSTTNQLKYRLRSYSTKISGLGESSRRSCTRPIISVEYSRRYFN